MSLLPNPLVYLVLATRYDEMEKHPPRIISDVLKDLYVQRHIAEKYDQPENFDVCNWAITILIDAMAEAEERSSAELRELYYHASGIAGTENATLEQLEEKLHALTAMRFGQPIKN